MSRATAKNSQPGETVTRRASALASREAIAANDSLSTYRDRPAQAALEKAEREHANRAATIQAEIGALEKRSRVKEDRSKKERERLQAVLRRARE